eukprot:756850-Hanusia_phi.AAC.2
MEDKLDGPLQKRAEKVLMKAAERRKRSKVESPHNSSSPPCSSPSSPALSSSIPSSRPSSSL